MGHPVNREIFATVHGADLLDAKEKVLLHTHHGQPCLRCLLCPLRPHRVQYRLKELIEVE